LPCSLSLTLRTTRAMVRWGGMVGVEWSIGIASCQLIIPSGGRVAEFAAHPLLTACGAAAAARAGTHHLRLGRSWGKIDAILESMMDSVAWSRFA